MEKYKMDKQDDYGKVLSMGSSTQLARAHYSTYIISINNGLGTLLGSRERDVNKSSVHRNLWS